MSRGPAADARLTGVGRANAGPARVTIVRTNDVSCLNPVLYRDLPTGEVLNRMFDHLVLTDDAGAFVPGRLLATWCRSPDGLVWDFELAAGARWHDGVPVTAHDACFTLELILDPETASPRRSEFLIEGEPIGYEAASDRVLRITLPAAHAPLLGSLAWRPLLPRHVYTDDRVRRTPDHPPVGSGAFRFVEWRPGERLTMSAWDEYHHGRPPLDHVTWRPLSDPDVALRALLSGSADYFAGLPPELVDEVEAADGVRIVRTADASFTYLGFRLDHGAFGDLRVRTAIGLAIDRDRLVTDALRGAGVVARSPIAPSSPWHHAAPSEPYDPRAAAHLLSAAGWAPGADGSRRDTAGARLEFTILTVAGDAVKLATAAGIRRDLTAVGIGVDIVTHEMGRLLELAFDGRFEAIVLGLTPGIDPAFLHGLYHSSMVPPGGWNIFGYADPQVDRLLDASQAAIDPAERHDLIAEVQRSVARDLPQVLLFHTDAVDAASDRLSLLAPPTAPGNRFMHLHRWEVQLRQLARTSPLGM